MLDQRTSERVRALLGAIDGSPRQVPIAEIAALARELDVDVTIDRAGDPPLVFVTPRRDAVFERLTRREQEVAALVAGGLRNGQIAEALTISVATVKDHVHAILGKTGYASRAQLVAAWLGQPPSVAGERVGSPEAGPG
jgi:DNA-binding NarL/FixJ family response regulator